MREVRDSEIKLFGKKIALPEHGRVVLVDGAAGEYADSCENDCVSERDRCSDDSKLNGSAGKGGADVDEIDTQKQEDEKELLSEEFSEEKDQDQDMDELESTKNGESELDNNVKTPPVDEDSPSPKSSKTENDQTETNNSQQKTLKKPDKILPCPRCNSMDTKFCYYNNYNVNQPRHFCKSCQRYWTAGGTMRNVPVGAGRRKNKNSVSHCRHITITEALQAARIDAPNGFHHPTYKPNGTVLSFGPESPLCESMASLLNLADKKVPNGMRNGFYKHEQGNSNKVGENGDDCSSVSSVTTTSSVAGGKNPPQEAVMPNINGFPSPVPCLPGVPWPFPWNAAVPLPAICPPGFPMPFCPAPYWNCAVPGPWSLPWLAPPSPTATQKASNSAPNSPLGKHSREGELLNPKNPEAKESSEQKSSGNSVLVPKTLRIDDPDEAAKSSIWSTLGIKYDSISRGGLFKALQPKSDEKSHTATPPSALQANPAALSRSLSFQESA